MSQELSNPISLLHKYIKVSFEDVEEIVLITEYDKDNEAFQGKINPGSNHEAYCELYKDDNPVSWYIVKILE